MKQIRIKEALELGWEGTKNNWPVLLGLFAVYFAAQFAQSFMQEMLSAVSLSTFGFWGLSMAVNILLGLIVAQFGLRIAVEKGARAASFGDLDLEAELVGRYFVASLIPIGVVFAVVFVLAFAFAIFAGVTVGLGALSDKATVEGILKSLGGGIVFFVVGFLILLAGLIYAGLIFAFATLAIIHQGLGPLESFKESMRLTEGIRGDLVMLSLAFVGLMLAGLLCLCVGIIPAIMVAFIAWPAVYLQALEQSGPWPTV